MRLGEDRQRGQLVTPTICTADVFTLEPMSGNHGAVVFDAEGLTTAQGGRWHESNYVEVTFGLPTVT